MAKLKAIELKIPSLGEAESTEIIEINIKSGVEIEKNDPLIVLESEKAAMEIPSDFSGKVLKVLVKEGDSVTEGQPYALIEAISEEAAKEQQKLEQPTKSKIESSNLTTHEPKKIDNSKINAGPAIRKYARELEINLSMINGTGKNGRITKDDLKNYIHSKDINITNFPTKEDFDSYGSYKVEKLSKIRALGAKNMSSSWTSIPHVTHFEEAEITAINKSRVKDKVSPLAYFVKIVSIALKEHTIFNSSLLNNNEVLLKDFINIGIAVDTPDGLVVPVLKDPIEKNVFEISDEIKLLAEKAKTKKLLTNELQGATFTISSLGKIGGIGFTPIINPPEVAILALSRSRKILKINDGELSEVEMIPFSLSYDHRVINGGDAGRFMDLIRDMIENYNS